MPNDDTTVSVKQSEEIEKEKNRVIKIVQEDRERRDQETIFFRNENLQTYTEVSKAQFIGHRSKPEWKKDYQYNVFDPVTRDKVMAIISKAGGLYEAQFFNANKKLSKFGQTIATILGAFYQDSTRRLNEKEKNKLAMLSALTTPKAIWYEGWRYQKRTIREIEDRDETGEVKKTAKKEIVHYNGPWGELVPVLDFIPGSLRIRDLQEQPRVAWVTKMQMEEFKRMFPVGKYPEANKVQPYHVIFDNGLQNDFIVRNDLKENEVEVIRFFEKWDDRMTVIANGIMLSKPNSPMPFAHKDYPFVWGGFEELDTHFIYDLPLTIKILDMQDVTNEILNLTLDMVWRALNEVILVAEGDGINDDVLYGGGMVSVNNPANFNKLEFGSNFGFNAAQGVLERVRRSIESSSVDAPMSGQAGAKAATAREVLVAREAALEIASLFLQNMENMERDKAYLRVKNQLDRYKRPVDWQKHVGDENTEDAIAIFREITVRDAKLDNGKRGTVNVNITETPRSQEELDELNVESDKELSQTIDISPDLIREIDFDVEIVANSSVKKSKQLEIAEARAGLLDAAQLPQVLNLPYFARKYVKATGDKEDEALVTAPTDPMQAMLQQMGQPQTGKPKPNQAMPPQDSIEAILNQQL